ncbi:MAG: hypothetical protein HUJ26_22605 [Planctomycetaceae bacterium]|nr:hypothetical protein [Planctomycetaceae bacterium]
MVKTMIVMAEILLASMLVLPCETNADDRYPSLEELPAQKKLPDPFQFFGSDRRVKTVADWEERQAEMMDLLQHYIFGPLFPPVGKYKIEQRTEEPLADGKVIKYTARLLLGPDLDQPTTIIYHLHRDRAARSILIDVIARDDPKDEDALEIAARGYDYAGVRVSPYEKLARNVYPDLEATRSMGWVWGINEIVYYLTEEHQFDKVILTGCSRYGRVATIVGAINKRVDLTAPITTLAHAVHLFDDSMWGPGNVKWAGEPYKTFAGKMDRLPVDRHFLGAVIAPRAYLAIMGKEKPAFCEGHIEAYESLIPVYEWLGVKNRLGLYDHSPRGHGVEMDDLQTVLDFADLIFFNKQPASGKQFDQIRNPDLDGFDWTIPARPAE